MTLAILNENLQRKILDDVKKKQERTWLQFVIVLRRLRESRLGNQATMADGKTRMVARNKSRK